MHSCRRIESRLVELLFDEVDVEERRRLLAEIEGCASCTGQYGSLSETLVVVERANAAVVLPPESYWPHYNAALRSRLQTPQPVAAGAETTKARPHIFQRLLRAELRIPLPVAAALLVGLIISSALAFRPTRVTPPGSAANVPPVESIRVVAVPVVKEKTVTRIVYVEKKRQPSRALAPLIARAPEMPDLVIARNKPEEETGFFTRANLKGFQPADEMKIRVLKRNDANDK